MVKNNSSWCQNFILRFFYEFFLEFSICIFLQLSVKDFSEFSPSIQFYMSVGITVAMIGLVIFILSLFFRNGPWIPNFYQKGTTAGSLMQNRPINPSFDREKYLNEHPKPEQKPWGRFIIHFDLQKLIKCGRKEQDTSA